jgi:regulator of RNase E activity RraB
MFGKSPKRYFSRKAFEKNLERQLSMTPQTVKQLRGYGVTPEKELRLEFFFYTDTAEKAAALAAELLTRKYEVQHGPAAGGDKTQIVKGWTPKMPMNDRAVLDWTREMCTVGYTHDCEFDGWGTNPTQ